MERLTVALPKGRMQKDVLALFGEAGYPAGSPNSRKLILNDTLGIFRFLLAKPFDVPTYVEHGAAALGVAGEDVLRENERDIYEPLGLDMAKCRLVLAGPPEARDLNLRTEANLRVASKYPRQARAYFQERGLSAEIISLSGSVELAPAVGLADLIVDLVQTGRTLRENGLVELETIRESQAMLVVNRASHKLYFQTIQEIIQNLADAVARRQEQKVAP
ncbi:MAG: ATP phosphoribosyltransferase [Chloroflexota bacterium]|nr:ATP phosphoribosyltransferase [Chloroflexota bacterium]